MIGADFHTGEVLWSIVWIAVAVLWIWLIVFIFADIIRSHDLSGWGKAIWAVVILIAPFIGILVYVIARGGDMSQRQLAADRDRDLATQTTIRHATARPSSTADQLAQIAALHDDGKLDDAEYAAAKSRILHG